VKCPACRAKLQVKESRRLKDEHGNQFIRRIRFCKNEHQCVTHEMLAIRSPIPDTYRPKRERAEYQRQWRRLNPPKEKQKKESDWLEKINAKLETTSPQTRSSLSSSASSVSSTLSSRER